MANFLVTHCHIFSDGFDSSALDKAVRPILSKEMALDMMRSLRDGRFSFRFRCPCGLRTEAVPINLIGQGEKTHECDMTNPGARGV